MKIIKDGAKPDMDISRLFTCHFCDCMFYADKGEYKWTWTNRPEFEEEPRIYHFEAKCPCCDLLAAAVETIFPKK